MNAARRFLKAGWPMHPRTRRWSKSSWGRACLVVAFGSLCSKLPASQPAIGAWQARWGVDVALHEHETVVSSWRQLLARRRCSKRSCGWSTVGRAVSHLPAKTSPACAPISGCGAALSSCRKRPDSWATIEENVLIGAQFLPRRRARERIEALYACPVLAECCGVRLAACPACAKCSASPRLWSAIRACWSWTNRRAGCRRFMSRR